MTDVRAAQLLGAAVKSLREEILPGTSDPIARIKIDHITRLLWDVAARLSKREDGLKAFLESASSIVPVAPVADDASVGELERQRALAEDAICTLLPQMIAAPNGIGALTELMELERNFYISQDPDVANGSSVVYRGGRIESDVRPATKRVYDEPDAAALTLYLQAKIKRTTVVATGVSRIPGGFSKETIFFTLTDTSDNSEELLVIRKDLPVPLMEKTVVDEFGLLKELYAAGFPVAEPMWLETDAGRFGGAFLVSRRASGTSDAARWAGDPVRAHAACVELAKLLATLHTFDPADFGFAADSVALSAGELMEREVAHWIDLFRRKRTEAFPLQEMPLAWLSANIPSILYSRPGRIVHGDVGFHNLMFDEAGRATALLDWEFSVLGDPTQDLCFVRQFVEPLLPWDEFLGYYGEAGGSLPCQEAEFFYSLWTKVRNSIGCIDAQALFDNHMPDEMRFALAGHIFAPYMFIDQCETLIDHLKVTAP